MSAQVRHMDWSDVPRMTLENAEKLSGRISDSPNGNPYPAHTFSIDDHSRSSCVRHRLSICSNQDSCIHDPCRVDFSVTTEPSPADILRDKGEGIVFCWNSAESLGRKKPPGFGISRCSVSRKDGKLDSRSCWSKCLRKRHTPDFLKRSRSENRAKSRPWQNSKKLN